jgi:hypothetical protein
MPKTAQSEPDSAERSSLAMAMCFNSLMLGCSEEGAINYLLDNGGGKVELIRAEVSRADADDSRGYDAVRVLRTGIKGEDAWARGNLCLYFRNGYLVRKCIIATDEKSTPEEIYRREIQSGLQHPPSYPGLMQKVHWGTAKEADVPASTGKKDAEGRPIKGVPLTKVRCGIVFESLPPLAKKQGFNVLVLFQNVGPLALDEDLQIWGFPVGPVVLAGFAKNKTDKEEVGFHQVFGIYGSKVREVQLGDKKARFRVGSYRLEPGESTFVWFAVPDLDSYRSINARVSGLFSEAPEGIRAWDSGVNVELKP